MRDRGIEVGKRRVVADEARTKSVPLMREIGADVVQHDGAQQRRPRRGQAHAEQPAETGADGDRVVHMQRGADVEHVAQHASGA